MKVFRNRIVCMVHVIVLAWGLPVLADDASESGDANAEDADARTAFVDATKLYNEKQYDEALKLFQKAYALKPSWKLYYNIGQAAVAAKRQGVAISAFEKYLTEGGDEIPLGRRDEVLKEVERLRQIVGAIDLKAPDGFEVEVDGVNRGKTPLVGRLRVSASRKHQIVLKDGDKVVDTQTVLVGGQETIAVTLSADNAPPTENVVAADDAETQRVRQLGSARRKARAFKIAAWSSLSAGGTFTLVGLLAGISARQQKKDNDDTDCTVNTDPDCETKLEKNIKEQEDTRDTALGALVLGVAGLVAAPFLFKAVGPELRRVHVSTQLLKKF